MAELATALEFAKTAAEEFIDAAACGDHEGVSALLSSPSITMAESINALDKDGRSAFHYACLNDDVPMLTLLLNDDRTDVLLTSPRGESGLHMSSLYAALSAMKLLFAEPRCRSLLDAQNNFGETALHLCAGSGDKSAAKAALLLLENGASLALVDKWYRGPLNVSHDNAENSLVQVLKHHIEKPGNEEIKKATEEITANYKSNQKQYEEEQQQSKDKQKSAILGALGLGGANKGNGGGGGLLAALGGVSLKKTVMKEKTMFMKSEGVAGKGGASTYNVTSKRPLSKLCEFPGDLDEITKWVEDDQIDLNGADAFGLLAIHKFASWNKTVFLELLLPKLSPADMNKQCPEGKTALHWAVEMAAVGAVKLLVRHGVDRSIVDGKGRTVHTILDSVEQSNVIKRLKEALQTS